MFGVKSLAMQTLPRLLCLLLVAVTSAFAQWIKLDSGTDASLRGVSAPAVDVCWATGSKGTVLRTTDMGRHWTKLTVPNADKLDFRDVEAFDARTAIIMSAGPAEQGAAKIFKTVDAGAHWKEVFSTDRKGVFLDSMAFWDKKHAIVFSDPVDGHFVLYTTEDGGDHWSELRPRSMPPALPNEGAFAASGTAIAVAGHHDVWFGTGGASVARVFHSPDRGQHWTAAELPIAAAKASAGVFGVAFEDSKHGVAVGGDYQKLNDELTAIATTKDGGATWKAIPQKYPPLEGVVFAEMTYVAVGSGAISGGLGWRFKLDRAITGNATAVICEERSCSQYVVGAKGEIWVRNLGFAIP